MLSQLDGTVSTLVSEGQPVVRIAVRACKGRCEFLPMDDPRGHVSGAHSYLDVPRSAQILCDHELVKFLVHEGHMWHFTPPVGRRATHVHVSDGSVSGLFAYGEVENNDRTPLFHAFDASPFCEDINQLITSGEEYMRAMADMFLIGMSHSHSKCY